MKSETIMLTVALALTIALIGGLVIVPAIQDVYADNGHHFGQAKNGNSGKHKGHGIDT
jgi:hypothetical protein